MALPSDVRPGAPSHDAWTAAPSQIGEIDAMLALDQFAGTETAGPAARTAPPAGDAAVRRPGRGGRPLKIVVGALVTAAAAVTAFIARPAFSVRPPAIARPAGGVLVLQSDPAGVAVSIDGHERGTTPLEVSLPPGPHELAFGSPGTLQRIPVNVTAGSRSTHYLHLASGALAGTAGALQLTGAPAGARVSLDGVARGRMPLRLDDVPPGPHRLSVAYDTGTVDQQVMVEGGRLTTVVLPSRALGAVGTAGSAAGGWLHIASPETVQVWERDQLIGTSETSKIMLPAGTHAIELVNDTVGYRDRRVISIAAGATNNLSVEMPQGAISVNATPWAEVWIDGRRVGDTPLGDFPIAAGRHAVTLRHPRLGEKQQQAVVRVGESTAISADLRR